MQEQTCSNIYRFIIAKKDVSEEELVKLLRLEFPWGVGVSNAALRDLIQTNRRSIALEQE